MVAAGSSLFASMTALSELKKGRGAYCLELRKSDDVYLSVNAWLTLIETKLIAKLPELWDELVQQCHHSSLRLRAFEFFESEVFEHQLAARVAACAPQSLVSASAEKMRAELSLDFPDALEADGAAFLASADLRWLTEAHSDGEHAGGWKLSLPWSLRGMMLNPTDMVWHQRIFDELDTMGDAALLAEYADILAGYELFPPVVELFRAAVDLYQGKAHEAAIRLSTVSGSALAAHPSFRALNAPILAIKARAEEKTGAFEAAHRDYEAMNKSDVPTGIDPEDFFRKTAMKRQLNVPQLPPDPRSDVVHMLGFARSGTTLLENVLEAHPQVETFEEIPALTAAIDVAELVIRGRLEKPTEEAEIYLSSRAKYYEEIDRRRRKSEAKALVDKMPLRGSEAGFVAKLFPDCRHIFSIRHPFDVVLSCFRQRFAPNPAMENFRTIAGAVRVYDLTMSEWFGVHSLEDPRVHYVRYEELVTDFERVVSGTLGFLGVEWDDAVRDFATGAQGRAARTPSYQKVRQGIGIGVQTYWRNYRFVFETLEAQPLYKWAEFFGYPTS